MDGEEHLSKEYPGRGIILGYSDDDSETVLSCVYFVMGRKPSSKARILKKDSGIIFTEPTDKSVLNTGNPELLLYNAIVYHTNSPVLITASNGRQTDTIFTEGLTRSGWFQWEKTFKNSLSQWLYEPDKPNFTPRIAGLVTSSITVQNPAYLGIIKKVGNEAVREIFELKPGEMKGITTYNGENKDPLHSYEGTPFSIELPTSSAKEIAEYVWSLLNPEFRISLAAVIIKHSHYFMGDITDESSIINAQEVQK